MFCPFEYPDPTIYKDKDPWNGLPRVRHSQSRQFGMLQGGMLAVGAGSEYWSAALLNVDIMAFDDLRFYVHEQDGTCRDTFDNQNSDNNYAYRALLLSWPNNPDMRASLRGGRWHHGHPSRGTSSQSTTTIWAPG